MYKINKGIGLQSEKKVTVIRNGFERAENELEKLSIQMITILKKYKEKGIIGEREYRKHTEYKKKFLTYLNNKRMRNTRKTE